MEPKGSRLYNSMYTMMKLKTLDSNFNSAGWTEEVSQNILKKYKQCVR
jgi:hypothetical protein